MKRSVSVCVQASALVIGLSSLSVPSSSLAQEVQADAPLVESNRAALPTAYAARPLVLPRMNLGASANVGVARLCFSVLGMRECNTSARIDATGALGVIDNLEVGVRIFGLQLAPDVEYNGAPLIYGRYRFIDGDVELGAELSVSFADFDPFVIGFAIGVPLYIHIAEILAIRTAVAFLITAGDIPDPVFGLNIPLTVILNIMPTLFVYLTTGFVIRTFDDVENSAGSPLGFGAGYTIEAGGSVPLVDIFAQFGWPLFLVYGAEDKVFEDLWQIQIGATVYIDLLN